MDDVPTSLIHGRVGDMHYILNKLIKDEQTDATAAELAHTAINLETLVYPLNVNAAVLLSNHVSVTPTPVGCWIC